MSRELQEKMKGCMSENVMFHTGIIAVNGSVTTEQSDIRIITLSSVNQPDNNPSFFLSGRVCEPSLVLLHVPTFGETKTSDRRDVKSTDRRCLGNGIR